jgi:hypothetical protein
MGLFRYRQLLFLLALILPSSAMVGLGWLALTQERELSEKRAIDAQKQILADIRQTSGRGSTGSNCWRSRHPTRPTTSANTLKALYLSGA